MSERKRGGERWERAGQETLQVSKIFKKVPRVTERSPWVLKVKDL